MHQEKGSLTKKEAAEVKNTLDENINVIKKRVDKIGDLSKITLKQKNFFLYNESNYINHMFFTELNKKIQIYSLISTDGIGLKSAELVAPATSVKFNILEKKFKEKIILQLEDIRRKEKIDVKGKEITNFLIL